MHEPTLRAPPPTHEGLFKLIIPGVVGVGEGGEFIIRESLNDAGGNGSGGGSSSRQNPLRRLIDGPALNCVG